MGEKVRIGVVGCGVVATAYYLPYISRMPDAELAAVCDLDPERTAACVRLFGAKAAFHDYDEMIERAELDAVFILTAPGTHARFAVRAAQAGKHLLIQKPMATTLEEMQAIADAVRAAGVQCLVEPSSNSPLEPLYGEIRALLKRGAIGQPYAFHWLGGVPDRDGPGLGGNPYGAGAFYAKDSGGFLFDYPYAPTQVVAALGACKSVMARGTIAQPDRHIVPDAAYTEFLAQVTDPDQANYWDVVMSKPRTEHVRQEAEDHFYSLCEMHNGAVGVIWVGRGFRPLPRGLRFGGFQVLGTEGNLVFGHGGNRASISARNKELLPDTDADGWYHWRSPAAGAAAQWPKPTPGSNYYQRSTQHLVDCIREGKALVVGLEWGLHITELMIGAKRSSDEGVRYELTTTIDW
ncbi:MAG TPA: Gfo/Idh/MocA family oxidoreductase [Limnochordia bacterium]|nr:Gfo/Idh/MocA family oxidoreductase [Limnochordia bacterium]